MGMTISKPDPATATAICPKTMDTQRSKEGGKQKTKGKYRQLYASSSAEMVFISVFALHVVGSCLQSVSEHSENSSFCSSAIGVSTEHSTSLLHQKQK